LGVFLSNGSGAVHRPANKIKKLGWYISDDDVKRLIAWAVREPASKIEGQAGFSYTTRPHHELYISGLA
jgi:hypothetical protein